MRVFEVLTQSQELLAGAQEPKQLTACKPGSSSSCSSPQGVGTSSIYIAFSCLHDRDCLVGNSTCGFAR